MLDEKTIKFNQRIEEIETDNLEVFSDRVNVITGKSPDKLRNHFMTTNDNGNMTCGFSKHTYVPVSIQNEVYAAFRETFSAK